MKVTVEKLAPFHVFSDGLTTADVFRQDISSMGEMLGSNIMRLFSNHSTEVCKKFVLVDMKTGERVLIVIEEGK